MIKWIRTAFNLSPVADETRDVWAKPSAAQYKSYYAASNSELFSDWKSTSTPINQIISSQLRTIRARSRDQAYNNDYMVRFLGLLQSNVVGPKGFSLASRPVFKEGVVDKLASDAIESAWKEFSKKENCHFSERFNLKTLMNLMVRTTAQDGEIFIQHKFSNSLPHGYAVELWDAELLDANYNIDLKDGRKIRHGIELDARGKPSFYHFSVSNDYDYTHAGRKYKKIPAKSITHLFLPQFLDQWRGIPWASSALARMKMLEGYENAAITAARAGASKMGFYTSPTGEEYTGDSVDSDGALLSDFEAGTMEQLPEGVSFQAFDPSYPNGDFPHFMKQCLRGISAGLNVAYNSLGNDLEGVNFSSIRAGVLEDREMWKALQEFFIENAVQVIFDKWLFAALNLKKVTFATGGTAPAEKYEKYKRATFQGRRWDWVDPLKDSKSNELQVEMHTKTVSQIIRDQGGDPQQVFEERAKELELMRSLGLKESEIVKGADDEPEETED